MHFLMISATLVTIAKLSIDQRINGWKQLHIYTMEHYLATKDELSFVPKGMDHGVMWNKSDNERQVLSGDIYM